MTPVVGRPAWEVAELFPPQGDWAEEDYLAVTRSTRRLVEFSDGCIELVPMPTKKHQKLVWWLARQVENVCNGRPGAEFLMAPYKLRIRTGKYREPDVLLILPGGLHRAEQDYATGADLVIEVVSPDDPSRDYQIKREDYARAGVREYWIVDPDRQVILLLALEGSAFTEVGTYSPGQMVKSTVADELKVEVAACFAAGNS